MRNQHFPLGKGTFFQCKFYTFTNDKTAILKQDICMNQIKEALGTRSINQTELANRHGMTLMCMPRTKYSLIFLFCIGLQVF